MSVAVKERPVRTVRAGRGLVKREREKLLARLRGLHQPVEEAGSETKKTGKLTLAELRAALGWSRVQLARVMNASDRGILNWEAGDPPSPVYAAKLREILNVYDELT